MRSRSALVSVPLLVNHSGPATGQNRFIDSPYDPKSWPFTEDKLRPVLHDGESVVAEAEVGPPIDPTAHDRALRGLLGVPPTPRSIRDARTARRNLEAAIGTAFPVVEDMVLVLTSERLLGWGPYGGPGIPGSAILDAPLWQIQSITTDYLPLGPLKNVCVIMQDGTWATIRASTHFAHILMNQFRRRKG
ncbi:MAG TPA: hypothetical protein VFZ97_08295 [Acidimicrobiales bacterium]